MPIDIDAALQSLESSKAEEAEETTDAPEESEETTEEASEVESDEESGEEAEESGEDEEPSEGEAVSAEQDSVLEKIALKQRELRQEREAFKAEREQWAAQMEQKAAIYNAVVDALQKGDVVALARMGANVDALMANYLDLDEVPKPDEKDSMREELEALRKERAEAEARSKRAQVEAQKDKFIGEATDFIRSEGGRWELVNAMDAHETVIKVMARAMANDGVELTLGEAADIVEKHLLAQMQRGQKAKKLQTQRASEKSTKARSGKGKGLSNRLNATSPAKFKSPLPLDREDRVNSILKRLGK